jgi:hypothetical protein
MESKEGRGRAALVPRSGGIEPIFSRLQPLDAEPSLVPSTAAFDEITGVVAAVAIRILPGRPQEHLGSGDGGGTFVVQDLNDHCSLAPEDGTVFMSMNAAHRIIIIYLARE